MQIRIILAFAATWLIWGSTYLAVAIAAKDVPPLMVGAVRNIAAGLALYLYMRFRGAPRPSATNWWQTAIVGVLLLGCGNGAVTWASHREPSGVVALMVALVPLWLLVFGWLGHRGVKPSPIEIIGVALGVTGILLLLSTKPGAGGSVSFVGFVVLLGSTVAWSAGSLYARQLKPMPRPLLGTGMEMMLGGFALAIASGVAGEWGRYSSSNITTRGVIMMVYLVVFGSIIGFSAYKWLLTKVRPALAGTYAFVNPVVAVALGTMFAGEAFTPRLAVAMVLITGAVAMISLRPYFSGR